MYWSLIGVIVAVVVLIAIGILAATQTISLSSGGIVAGIIAAFVLLFVSGFFLYRYMRARAISSAAKAAISSSTPETNAVASPKGYAAKETSMVQEKTPLSYHDGWGKSSQQSMRRSSHRLRNLASEAKKESDGEQEVSKKKEKAPPMTPEQVKLFKDISKQVKTIQKKQKQAEAAAAASGSTASEETAVPTEMQKRLKIFKNMTKKAVSWIAENQDQLLAIAKAAAQASGDEKLIEKVELAEQLKTAHAEA